MICIKGVGSKEIFNYSNNNLYFNTTGLSRIINHNITATDGGISNYNHIHFACINGIYGLDIDVNVDVNAGNFDIGINSISDNGTIHYTSCEVANVGSTPLTTSASGISNNSFCRYNIYLE